MTTFTNSKLTDEYVSNATLIRLMLWAQIAHADVTNIRIEELKEHQAA